ncbi:hypothetical protein HG535_0F01820 [Zygotorulaspora mrakii]|uniref:Uncharacterized protein n=1 Tax=Zygotorulaspora mrakii TaxID=42260 RepID=A0A7H9B4Q6_ZYGMR|nr:uncharacterized protein HG535_0F01820 [Zygotorulaspora mrakii]QLG73671.1 hypothetical protein HG535_0F01820 [Zygotorulaspora mrakii]
MKYITSVVTSIATSITLFGSIVSAASGSNGAFFTSLEVFNTLSGDFNCTDPNQWFVINAGLYIPEGSNEPIYLSVPDSLGNLPNGSFPLKAKNDVIGAIENIGSNNFTLTFNDHIQQNTTTSFSVLTKLTAETQEKISKPQVLNLEFDVSSGDSFTSAINFIPKDVNQLSTNGGIYAENNTAWFIADLPLSALDQPSRFSSRPTIKSSYKFNTSLTACEMILKVDDLNRPLKTVPFTALHDQSDSSQISIYINTNIDGGKYLRIKYFSEPLTSSAIGNMISLQATDSENTRLAKRDNAPQTITANYYSGNDTGTNDSNGSDLQSIQQSPMRAMYINATSSSGADSYETYSLLSRTGSAIVTQIGTWIPISTIRTDSSLSIITTPPTASQTTSIISTQNARLGSSSAVNSSATSDVETASPSSATLSTVAQASALSTSRSSFSNSGSLYISAANSSKSTNSQTTTTARSSVSSSSAISNSTQSLKTLRSTRSDETSSRTTFAPYSADYNKSDSYLTYSVISFTNDGELTSFTSWFAIATESASSSFFTSSSLSTTPSVISTGSKNTATAPVNTSLSTMYDSTQEYSLITKTQDGKTIVSTSWFPVSTIKSSSSFVKQTIVSTISKGAQSSADSTYETYSLVTRTVSGAEVISSDWFPVNTVENSTSFAVPVTSSTVSLAVTTSQANSDYETYSLVTKTKSGEKTELTNWAPISAVQPSTKTVSQDSCMSCIVTTDSSVPLMSTGTTLSIMAQTATSQLDMFTLSQNSSVPALSIYEGEAKRTSFGFGGILVGLLLLLF